VSGRAHRRQSTALREQFAPRALGGAMHDDLHGFREDVGFVAVASSNEPLDLPEPPPPRTRCVDARRALWWAVLGVVCFGFVFGPVALTLAYRARLAIAAEPELEGAGTAQAAMTIGRMGMALHLTLLAAALPWILFTLSLASSG
jgi:hypothetical protein